MSDDATRFVGSIPENYDPRTEDRGCHDRLPRVALDRLELQQ